MGCRSHRAAAVALLATAAAVTLTPRTAPAAAPRPAHGSKVMVATAHPRATEAALTVLRQGGKAADAAAAAAFALGVVEPYSAGIGGGGFALVYDRRTQKVRALDFRERAPLAAHRDLYLDGRGEVISGASTTGHLAAAVPGTVAGLEALVQAHGALKLDAVIAPAFDLANRGVVVTPMLREATLARLEDLRADPGARDAFLSDGDAHAVGDLLVQRDLADTLQAVAAEGSAAFYRGETAAAIAADMAESGGLISIKDLESYRPVWREPVRGAYRGLEVVSMPLPSSGGLLLLEMLGVLERDATSSRERNDPRTLHTTIEAARRAYADRAERLGDPAFLRGSVDDLIAPQRLDQLHRSIDPRRRTPSSSLTPSSGQRPQGSHTSHLCVVDAEGNAVALTFTVNTLFGAAVVIPGTGILLNNEMDDFALKPGVPNSYGLVGAEANAVAPAKIPLSSMTPTMVFEKGELRLVVGSPGGSTIITTVMQVILNVFDYGMHVGEAVAAPRVHHQWLPDEVYYEPYGLDPETRRHLFARGHTLVERRPWGNATAIQIREEGTRLGAADPRGEGSAAGY